MIKKKVGGAGVCRPNNLGAFLEVGEKMYTVQLTYLLLFIF